jgi:hypothetical protein
MFYFGKNKAHAWLTGLCLQYLTLETFSVSLNEALDLHVDDRYAFRRFATFNWYRHVIIVRLLIAEKHSHPVRAFIIGF